MYSNKYNNVAYNLQDATMIYKQQLVDFKEEQQKRIEEEVRNYIEQTMCGGTTLSDIEEEIDNVDDIEFRAIYYKSLNHVLYEKLLNHMINKN